MKVLKHCTILWAIASAMLCTQIASSADQNLGRAASTEFNDDEPLTWDKFASRFQFGLHHTMRYESGNRPQNPTIYYDGPDSPFVTYVREMRTYGFSGILLQIRLWDERNRVRRDPDGKWRIPEWVMERIQGAVSVATDCGYYLVIEVNTTPYEAMRDGKSKAPHSERLTDNYVQRDYDAWEQVVKAFRTYPNVAFRVSNEFHGYKYEQTLAPNHPDYLTKEQAKEKFIRFITEKGRIARTIKPDAWVFYRNQGQLIGWLYTLPYPLGIDRPPTTNPCYYGISHNFNTGDYYWGYWGLNHPHWTHERLKYLRINRKQPPHRESTGLLTEFRKTNNMGALANRFGSEYHYKPRKYGDRNMTDFQMMAQSEFLLDYFNRNKCTFSYADGNTSGGMKANGIFNTVRQQAHVYNSPFIDKFLHLILEKSYSRQLKLRATKGGTISHELGAQHRGMHMVRIGDRIVLKALPSRGYTFTGWRGSVNSPRNPLTVTVPDAHGTIWATFTPQGGNPPAPELYELKRHWDVYEVIEHGYVDAAKPDTNFGDEVDPIFRPVNPNDPTDAAAAKYAFLKFNIDRIPADRSSIAYATIKFHNVSTGSSKPILHTHSTDTSWKRETLTWNNMPKRGTSPISADDYSYRLQARTHLEVTDYFRSHDAGIHSFCTSGTEKFSRKFDIRITSSNIPDSIKTVDKPLLYVVWDEKMPIIPWGKPAPPAAQAVLHAPLRGATVPATQSVNLKWGNGGNAESFRVHFGTSPNVGLVHEQDDALYDDFDLVYNPGQLARNKAYYWRIDSVTRDGRITMGALWSFRTGDR